jgi:hypothetical protein
VTEIPFPLGGFFGKNMAKVLLFVLYLAASGEGIALGRAFLGFHLRHRKSSIKAESFLPENSEIPAKPALLLCFRA